MQDNSQLGKTLKERYDALLAIRRPWETLWSDIAKYVMPRRSPGILSTVTTPSSTDTLFDTTAVQANLTLANGQLAWMSPMEADWFGFDAPDGVTDDSANKFLAECSKRTRKKLAASNFYTAIHEFYLDRGGFGTGCLYAEISRKRNGSKVLNVQCWSVGTFVIDEDADGQIDTVMRSMKMTARQAVQKFGIDNVSEKVAKASQDPKNAGDKFEFIHAIYPRLDAEKDAEKRDAANMDIASVYFELDSCKIALVGGYPEMPVFVSRYLEWGTGLGGMYGWSPSFVALPEARQLNFLQMWMDYVAEKMADPPWLAPDELEGEIDANPRGVTYFSRDLAAANAMPRPLATETGRIEALLQRVQERQKAIRDAFHVDLFEMFAQIEKQMTAREVAERSQEKLIQFSPTFARLTTELFNPLLERLFALGIREAWFDQIPESLLVPVSDTEVAVTPPGVQYASRIALALRSLPSLGYMRTIERLGVVAPLMPQVLDNYDFDAAEREASMIDGVPSEFLRDQDEVDEIRERRAEAEARAQQMQQAAMAADAAGKLGGIKADSPAGKALGQAMEGQQLAA